MIARWAALAAIGALAIPAASHAAPHLRSVDTSNYPHVRLTVVTSSPTAQPTVRENGKPAAALRVENLGREKSIALLVDRSRSMTGSSLDDALAAVRAFIAGKPRADRVAVVTFGSRALQLTGFSSAPDDAEAALASLRVDSRSGTALYDAVAMASSLLAREPNAGRVILLVTDGRDVSSHVSLERAVAAARAASAVVYPVGIRGPQFTPDALSGIAQDTGGLYRGAASSSALAAIYLGIAQELQRTWRVDYVTAGRPGDHLQLVVGGDGERTAAVSLPGTPGARERSGLPAAAYGQAGAAALALIVGLIVLLAAALAFAAFRSGQLQERLAPHLGKPERKEKQRRSRRDRFAAFAGIFRVTERAFAHTRHWRSVQRLLERADLPLRTVEFFYVAIGISFGFALLLAFAGASPVAILVAFVVGGIAPFGFLSFKATRRQRAFEAQLPDLLISLAASLKAGHSFKQGLQSVVDEGIEPAGKELKRVLTEMRLGRPLENSLAEMADRLGSENFAFVITAVNIQSQIGGSLAGLFDTVADTVRQRQQFSRKIRALTAMGRMSAYVLLGLPFVVAGALTLLNPHYMSPLYHTTVGRELITAAFVMMLFGGGVLRKIVSFKG